MRDASSNGRVREKYMIPRYSIKDSQRELFRT